MKREENDKHSSISSSLTIPKQSPGYRLIDIVKALEERGRNEEAFEYGVVTPLLINLTHGYEFKDILEMSIEDITILLKLPPKQLGWDNFFYGRAVLGDSDQRNL